MLNIRTSVFLIHGLLIALMRPMARLRHFGSERRRTHPTRVISALQLCLLGASITVLNCIAPVAAQTSSPDSADFPQDIRLLSCLASNLGQGLIALEPPPGLRSWAIANMVRHAYAVQSLQAATIESEDPEAAKRLRDKASRSLRAAKQSGWEQLQQALPTGSAMSSDLTALAFWTSAAWGALISLDRDDLEALADWPKAKALAERVRSERPDFGEGAALALAASFELSSPGGNGARARQWFAQAIEQFGATQAMLHVSMAEQLDLSSGDQHKFEERLRLALAIAARYPGFENRLAAHKANWLLSRSDMLF